MVSVYYELSDIEQEVEVSSLVMPVKAQFDSPLKNPTGLTFDGAYLWLSSADESAIVKLNMTDCNIVEKLELEIKSPWGLTWDGENLWVTDFDTQQLFRVDVETSTLKSKISTPGLSPTGLTWNGENLITADYETHKVYTIDPTTGDILKEFKVKSPAYNPSGLAWDGESLWVADISASYIFKLDPEDGNILLYYYSSDYYPSDMTWAEENLWTLDYSTSTIFETLPGEKAVQKIPVKLPSWFPLLSLLIITPVTMWALSSYGEKKISFEAEEKQGYTGLGKILHIAAVLGSIYTSFELFRIIYNVVILNKIVHRGNIPLLVFRFEMLLCLGTLLYWLIYGVKRILKYIKPETG